MEYLAHQTPEQLSEQTLTDIRLQYKKYLYPYKLPYEYKLEILTNFFYDLMNKADQLTDQDKPFHALAIITTSLSHLPEIDEYALTEQEVPYLIEHFGHSLRKTLSQSPPDQSQQLLNNYNTFLTTLTPNNLYLDELHHLPLSPI
jgi:hypothetical protein